MDVVEGSTSNLTTIPRRNRWFWAGTVVIVLLELFTFAFAAESIFVRRGHAPVTGWTARLDLPNWVIGKVGKTGPSSGLREGDQVVSVNGERPGWLGPAYKLTGLDPGQDYTLTLRRGQITFPLRLKMSEDPTISLADSIETLVTAVLLFVAGLWIRLGGSNDMTSRLGSGAFLLGGIATAAPVLFSYPGSVSTAWLTVALVRLPRPIEIVLAWDFLSRFPHRVTEGPLVRWLRAAFYTLAAVFWIGFNIPVLAEFIHAAYPPAWSPLQWLGHDGPFLTSADAALDGVVSVASCYVLLRNYKLLADRDSRRRIRLAALAFAFGSISILLLRFFEFGATITRSPAFESASQAAEIFTTFAVALMPITLAYAVMRHRVLGIRLVIRRGLQYLLAKNVLRLLLLTPALIVLLRILREPDRSFSDLLFRSSWRFYLLVMGTAALSLRYRREVTRWLDRRFFRTALQEEESWVALTEAIRTASSEVEIAGAVAKQIESALPVESVHVFFRSPLGRQLRLAFPPQAVRKGLDLQRAEALAQTVLTPLPAILEAGPSEASVTALMGTGGQPLGAIVLGPKKSEQPYTRKERELLQAVAAQVVMACEVLRLKRSVDEESRQRIAVLGRLERENIHLLNECLQCGECFAASQTHCPVDGTPLQLTLPVERVIAGKYWLNRRLGAGGMGAVYEALDLRQDKLVAVKIMLGELFGNETALVRFRREAQAVASLRHPNIVGLLDFGQLPAGGAFLVMDLVPGLSWRKHLQSPKPLFGERVAHWAENLCQGVAAAHRAGIVHRDLKPENVMIAGNSDGEAAMVLDFGLAKLSSETEHDGVNVSVTGMVMGTQAYMSPEQRAGKSAGRPTDIYSIAVMTLETLARLGPPRTGATTEWAKQALQRVVPSDSKLCAVFSSALADAPEVRIQEAGDFGRWLSEAVRAEKPTLASITKSEDAETLGLDEATTE